MFSFAFRAASTYASTCGKHAQGFKLSAPGAALAARVELRLARRQHKHQHLCQALSGRSGLALRGCHVIERMCCLFVWLWLSHHSRCWTSPPSTITSATCAGVQGTWGIGYMFTCTKRAAPGEKTCPSSVYARRSSETARSSTAPLVHAQVHTLRGCALLATLQEREETSSLTTCPCRVDLPRTFFFSV